MGESTSVAPPDTAPTAAGAGIPARAVAFLGCAGLVFVLLLVAAFTWDCAGYISTLHADAGAAELEQRNQEERVIAALDAAGVATEEVSLAITSYRNAARSDEKDRLYNGIISAAGRAPRASAGVDDPLARRAADELAGAQNRRAIALRNRQEMTAQYNAAAAGLRGAIGRRITGLPSRLP